ncbi:hypothetical protein [Leifsonia shinshuensis]|uniref:Uncharacterized protein n=1 Tax=Leifsonia shinshuensis TaxID=150026 RepID=A0A7G6YEA0_9MICO|nr:hypothetical protein [Leifsonia shinshuensis]QNE36815.1 hypothetical protein F1C12_17960 [Leifsonia shinshuensis]
MTKSNGDALTLRGREIFGPSSDANLLPEEVRILWDFVHGDIMDGTTRRRLLANRGMCTRHAWAYATVEIELWHDGAGARGGHQPFDVSVLYTALLEDVRWALHGPPKAMRRHLASGGVCVVCADLKGPALTGIIVTHAGMDLAELTVEANRMAYIAEWFTETAPLWSRVVCAQCAGDHGEAAPEASIRCRRHLLDGAPPEPTEFAVLASYLGRLQQELSLLTASMTQSGTPATSAVDASWVETLGWFHGWAFPLTLSSQLE